jgi:hypothetical protein
MLKLELSSRSPFGYRVTGDPPVNDPKVDVTFTRSAHRYSVGPILGPTTLFNTGEGTQVHRQEARWLTTHDVIAETY